MRDESSPFLDEALRGIGAGVAGALMAFSIYSFRNAHHPGVGEVGPQLAAEVASFTVVFTALMSGLIAVVRRRIGRFPAIFLIATVIGPPAVAFASARFGRYAIPFVDHFVVGGGLFVTFLFLVKRFAPSARMGRVGIGVLVGAIPFVAVAALLLPIALPVIQEYRYSFQEFDPAILGALAGCVIGPMCGLWVCLAVFVSAPKVPPEETASPSMENP